MSQAAQARSTGKLDSVHAGDGAPTSRMTRLSRIHIATLIQAQQVFIHLQPIVHLSNGSVFAYEGLVRCGVADLASPLQLLSAAVEQGTMGILGRHLRHQATRMAPGARLFINVHPSELDEEFLASADDPVFAHTGEVVIEVPESAPLVRYRFAHSTLETLRRHGIKLAIDDFGAGYSNLGYLTTLAPDVVKLDRELVAGAVPGSRQAQLLASLNALCVAQGAVVVAEGIETEAELDAVIQAGIPLAQGYLLGRPSLTGAVTWKR
ncbi:MAG TPA: EAL domain-containing protein [Kofleriaceae bacterium]